MDLVVHVPHLPQPGETVIGGAFLRAAGGKGANQAVAAARLGAETTLLARVGDDEFGHRLRKGLAEAGVRTGAVKTVADCPSGIALILVDASGQNCIVITAGANGRLEPEDIYRASDLVAEADAVVLQQEIPAETVARTIRLARGLGKPTIVDAAPPREPMDRSVFDCTILTPNEAEAAALLGIPPAEASAKAMAEELLARGPQAVVVKAGRHGAAVAQGDRLELVPAFRIEPVDATAAGDAFTAALALEYVKGTDLVEAARVANAAGALACLKHGAQPSMPTADEVAEFLKRNA